MPQVMFLAMLLNDTVTLGILCGWLIDVMELPLKELQWSIFQVWARYPTTNSDQEEEENSSEREKCSTERNSTLLFIMAFPPFHNIEEMANHVRKTFKWHLRRASRSSRLLIEDYQHLCPTFTVPDAEEAACDFDIRYFHAVVINDAVELSVVSRDMVEALKLTLKGLQWTTFKSWLSVKKHDVLKAQLH
ncbi:hypothetical protein Cgig2_025343 [Carnegiea gigantea]|uniref:Uncharacterized protein n=1 Tax=Carnegiea gigantea TaxID=171969 RepID=A0A9Q1Q5N2_9CARY|nr:hypothetical protein Cgig2_025343 [Carnegiea gigantea]